MSQDTKISVSEEFEILRDLFNVWYEYATQKGKSSRYANAAAIAECAELYKGDMNVFYKCCDKFLNYRSAA